MGDRHKRHPWGLFGGGEAASAAIRIRRQGSDKWLTAVEGEGKLSPSKFAGVIIKPGDRVWLSNGGGGGWGDPRGRDPQRIAEDLREGWISEERARRDYGWSPASARKTGG
jgi:N-methylhydantoinase B/oxoprolinase/acetone carboxylase alpha subunit